MAGVLVAGAGQELKGVFETRDGGATRQAHRGFQGPEIDFWRRHLARG